MKICSKCGNVNLFKPGDKIECKKCGGKLGDKKLTKSDPKICTGGYITLRKLLHDEYPWER